MPVFVEGAAESVPSADVEVRDLLRAGYRFGERVQGCGCPEVRWGRCSLQECPDSRSACNRWRWFQMSVRSSNSCQHVCTQRSMTEFILGIWTPLSTTWIPASLRTVSNRPGNLPSRSRIRNRARLPGFSRSLTRFLAAWTTQEDEG